MKKNPAPLNSPETNPYPKGFVYGQGTANPSAFSLSGLKISRALRALREVTGSVLELGCGGGQYLRALQAFRPDLKLYAIDLDTQAVACVQQIEHVTCVQADAAHLPFPDQHVDAIVGFDIIEHVPDPAQVLRECARVLRPHGLIHCYIPCEGNPHTVYVQRGHENKARFGGHQQQYTTVQLQHLFADAGFAVSYLRHADYWLTQQLDYLFFDRLAKSPDPASLWAAQALQKGGGLKGWLLRNARRILSAVTWLEGTVRLSAHGAMGVHITARKNV